MLALDAAPIEHHLDVTMIDGSIIRLTVRTPSVEHAVILKAYATKSRTAGKDYVDLYNLLLIAHAYEAHEIGGWRLDEAEAKGARKDARRNLLQLADSHTLRTVLNGTGVPVPQFTQLIRRYVGE
ncbi:hypothetical protein SAMN04488565_2237 [Leucobacter chromiiresistens]|uniref:Uncharacterized protein n=2 Tax=Leucobacter chromiiresistens TaxID=1079994 RepID=A0A1H1A0V3_9MICO|nr:hypothetical protein SAMN04488565_2237 [Leucobacter chromiiresistens]